LNRGRHLCSAGRPSGWALAHILVTYNTQRDRGNVRTSSIARWKAHIRLSIRHN